MNLKLRLPVIFFAISFLLSLTRAPEAQLFIDEPVTLSELEKNGFSLAERAFSEPKRTQSNAELKKNAAYATIIEHLAAELNHLKASDPLLGISMAATHRLFDAAWLVSSGAYFELIGVINRIDRAPFQRGTCGELRFIYRLAYTLKMNGQKIYSRLPMTVNVVFWAKDGANNAANCHSVSLHYADLLAGIRKNARFLTRANLKSIEINLQSVRWPSTVRPEFGGYAEYLLRVFRFEDKNLVLAPLENTPDVARIRSKPQLKRELIGYLGGNFDQVDDGIINLPEKFLSKKITSVALNGHARLANLPFSQLFDAKDFADFDLTALRTAKTPAAFIKRLNDMTCSGCHEGRATAGFHFLGTDLAATDAVNALLHSGSAHFFAEQPRRQVFNEDLRNARIPNPRRDLSLRAGDESGKFGAACGVGDSSYENLTCDKGLHCESLNAEKKLHPLGVCLPDVPIAGSPCINATAHTDENPHRDRLTQSQRIACSKGYSCSTVGVGFPGGMCTAPCSKKQPGEICGSIANLRGFNDCLASGEAFAGCLKNNVRPSLLKSCGKESFCRHDYICARNGADSGACIPPYFMFQLRIDGHPKP